MSAARPLTRTTLKAHPPPPVVDGDKETTGLILVLAGSRQVPGAALLVATSAMRVGAGKLRIATVESVAPQLAIAMPEAYVVALPEHRDGGFARSAVAEIREEAERATAVVGGPGVEHSPVCARIAGALLESSAQVVLDAALLHSLQPVKDDGRGRDRLPILLPHAGELASLLECDEQEVADRPLECGRRAAQLYDALVLVKGVASHVVTPDGQAWIYKGGAPGLGISGSGDTLAGIVGGLLARGAEPLTALLWGVLLHGEAGEVLTEKVGPVGFLAREIPDELPALLIR